MKTKRIPMRSCVGCRLERPKKELVRVVKNPDGTVELDATGKKSGRGAYICPNISCLKKATQGKQLERSLSTEISQDIILLLEQQINEQDS